MPVSVHQRLAGRLPAVIALLALALVLTACSQPSGGSPSGDKPTEKEPQRQEQAAEEPDEPEYSSYVVYINDEDSYSEGGITYTIALNLTATNPTGDVAGTYSGSATARTTTNGAAGGAQLNAEAIANSSQLVFTLDDPTAGGALAQITSAAPTYIGTGAITMKAAGTANVGPASGGFSNTSGQKLDVKADGSKVTLSVAISGHTYTFDGTISGK